MTPQPRELQELVRTLHQQGTPWLPSGLGSRLDWGPPSPMELVLSCRELNGVIEHSPGDFTVRVRAGTPLLEVQAALAQHRQWLAIDMPWGSGPSDLTKTTGASSGSIGGLVARGLAGGYRQRYLGIRDQLIGISLIRADGVEAKAGGKVVKNVAGYDLMRLLAGSWGSLGLITELNLRTLPIPPGRLGLWIRGDLTPLAELGRWLLNSSLSPERIDWWRPAPGPLGLVVSLASISRQTLNEQLLCLQEKTAAMGLASTPLGAETLAELEADGRGVEGRGEEARGASAGAGWLLRLGLRSSEARALLASPSLEGFSLVLGAGSGLGYAWCDKHSATAMPAYRVEALRRLCTELGGYLNVLKQPPTSRIPAWLDTPARPMVEAIKRQFDPKQQLARGRLPGVQPLP
ncbi:FAD-binding oxidoreductase [Cyanobium sp. WAJ14-Wanaka]|uniref:FAD-binding oxidoreductase n=1 Tax=Cyanobium sp. WAJ14-Wanaka TaxID=2823725 RepID=UPI0020CF1100|nr:FAD-binding oxidoreductase [Cyanobium sp. WAJ14-Wanaka]MCP9775755.1 FAD-binding oxidoreductase [Cyanobium sp. WAJ14-Wanaka]